MTIDNLTTGQSWSFDIESSYTAAISARRGDELRVRYNVVSLGYIALLGSGITVVDLNRSYRVPTPGGYPGKAQCDRRIGSYEGRLSRF